MSFDDDAAESYGLRPPPHPDDRLWRHPSEMAAGGSAQRPAHPVPHGNRGLHWGAIATLGTASVVLAAGAALLFGVRTPDVSSGLDQANHLAWYMVGGGRQLYLHERTVTLGSRALMIRLTYSNRTEALLDALARDDLGRLGGGAQVAAAGQAHAGHAAPGAHDEDLVREAAKQSPGREDLTLTLARVLAANNHKEEAGRVLDRVAASGTAESFMKNAAEMLRGALAQIPEAQAATQEFFAPANEPAQQSVEIRAGSDDDIPEGVLVPVNPRKMPEGETVSGKLSMLDCTSGLTVILDADGKTVRLHSNNPDKIEFITFSDAVRTSISCGPAPSLPVTIIFRPDSSGKTQGEPIRIEFTDGKPGK